MASWSVGRLAPGRAYLVDIEPGLYLAQEQCKPPEAH